MQTTETSIYLGSRQLEEGIEDSITESGVSLMRVRFWKLEEDLGEVVRMNQVGESSENGVTSNRFLTSDSGGSSGRLLIH